MGANFIKVNGQLFPIGGGGGTSGVSSVNGRTGAVTLSKADVDLNNVPNVTTDNQTPTVTEASTRTNIASGDTLKTIIGKIKKFFTDLKTVAFTGSYDDLSDTPTIPTVGNGTLTIQRNGTTLKSFSANQSGDDTVNITVPTTASEVNAIKFDGDLRDLGNNTPASATKTYFDNNVANNKIEGAYNSAGNEYSILFGRGASAQYGNILKWGYADKYLYILRKQSNAWKSDDWEKIDAGNADTVNGHTVNKDVPSDAKFTDTTYSLATTSADGLMSSADKIKVETISTKYGSNDLTEATLANDDKVPFYDTSEGAKRNSTWSNIKAKLKTYFDDIYPSKNSLARVATTGYYSDLHNTPSSLPASDVYAWAKAATKPTYTPSEVGLGNVPNVTTNNQTPTFTQASSRVNIASGETLATILGKIMKWYADLKTVAFSGSSSDINFDSNTSIYEHFLNFFHQNQGVYDTSLSIGYDGIEMQGEDVFELRSYGVRWNNKYKSWNDIIVGGGGGLSPTVLWTNPSPTSSFASQTVALSQALSNFTYYMVIFKSTNGGSRYNSTGLLPVGLRGHCNLASDCNYTRPFDFSSDYTGIVFDNCKKFGTYGSGTQTNSNNNCTPYQIIGFK